jgi:hypothetical protein
MRRSLKRTIRDVDHDTTRVTAPRGSRLVFVRVSSAFHGGSTSANAFTSSQALKLAKALRDAASLIKRGGR